MTDDGADLIGRSFGFPPGDEDPSEVMVYARSEPGLLIVKWSSNGQPSVLPVEKLRTWLEATLLVEARSADER